MLKKPGRLTLAFLFGLSSQIGFSDDGGDSSAMVEGGYENAVQESNGVVLRVPVNDQGEEWGAGAELRLYQGEDAVDAESDLRTVWNKAKAVEEAPPVTEEEINQDSSTWGWCCWGWRLRRWLRPFRFLHYRPHYYHYGTYYSYNHRPYYNTHYRHRYYYWHRYW